LNNSESAQVLQNDIDSRLISLNAWKCKVMHFGGFEDKHTIYEIDDNVSGKRVELEKSICERALVLIYLRTWIRRITLMWLHQRLQNPGNVSKNLHLSWCRIVETAAYIPCKTSSWVYASTIWNKVISYKCIKSRKNLSKLIGIRALILPHQLGPGYH
jgi:hypothetical protein